MGLWLERAEAELKELNDAVPAVSSTRIQGRGVSALMRRVVWNLFVLPARLNDAGEQFCDGCGQPLSCSSANATQALRLPNLHPQTSR